MNKQEWIGTRNAEIVWAGGGLVGWLRSDGERAVETPYEFATESRWGFQVLWNHCRDHARKAKDTQRATLTAEAKRLDDLGRSAFHRDPTAPETLALMAQCRAAWAAAHAAR